MTSKAANEPAKARDRNLDFVRVLACLAVILLHISARPIYMQDELGFWGWLLGNSVSSLTHWCVPVFVMLSAALLLGKKNTTYAHILRYRAPRMLAALAISILIYALWIKYFQGNFNASAFASDIVKGVPYYHLHFFYLIIGLYLIAPPLSQAVLSMGRSDLRNAIIAISLITITSFAWSTFSGTYTPNGSTFSWPYICYFLIGYYLYRYKPDLPYGKIVFAGYAVTVLGTQALAYGMGSDYAWKLYFYSYFSPTVLALAIGVWGLGLRAAERLNFSFLKALAPLTLLVYITHPMFMELMRYIYGKMSTTLMTPLIEIPMTFFFVTLLSFLSAYFLRKINFIRRIF